MVQKNKHWEYDVSRNPVAEGEFWIKQHVGRPPNTTFPFEGAFYLDQRKLHFDPKHSRWFAQEGDGRAAQWVPDSYFEGEYKQGGTEQLSPTVLIRWKKQNEPETVESLIAPTDSPHITYRESAEPSGESESEWEKEEKNNPFDEPEEETGLEYAEADDVLIPTIEQETLAETAAEVIETLSLEPKPIVNPTPVPDLLARTSKPAPIPDLLTQTSIFEPPKPKFTTPFTPRKPDPKPEKTYGVILERFDEDQIASSIWRETNWT